MGYGYGRINRLYKNREIRKDYKSAGDKALSRYNLSAKYVDQYIFIQFVSRPFYEEGDYEVLMDKELNPSFTDEMREAFTRQRNWKYEASFGLELNEIPRRTFKGIHLGKWIVTDDGKSIPDEYYNISKKEYLRGMEIIEAYMESIVLEPAALTDKDKKERRK